VTSRDTDATYSRAEVGTPPRACPEAAFGRTAAGSYFAICRFRSPAAFLDDSIILASFAAEDVDKPRHGMRLPVRRLHDLSSVAPLARFIRVITSDFLLVRSASLAGGPS